MDTSEVTTPTGTKHSHGKTLATSLKTTVEMIAMGNHLFEITPKNIPTNHFTKNVDSQ